ncbi:endonuclease [Bacteroidia bacterium]|nr:endonuclease [Bacteroidia bacterium]
MKKIVFFLLLFVGLEGIVAAQKPAYKYEAVGFYNLENLYDTISDDNDDKKFLPDGANHWTGERYRHKLKNMAHAISQIAVDVLPSGLTVLGVSEVENKRVLEDLVATPPINKKKWGIVHYDSPDARGVDVALLYQKTRFEVISSRQVPFNIANNPTFKSRDQLVVTGKLDGEVMHFIVVHWPSRYGGEERSRELRMAAAQLTMRIVDSLYKSDINAKIIIMGDFNDDPDNPSLASVMNAKEKPEEVEKRGLFNSTYKLFREGKGSLAYDDRWNMFDQQILSEPFMRKDFSGYQFHTAHVFDANFLKTDEGRYKNYPFRTFVGSVWQGGYSDHFPSYVVLIKNLKQSLPREKKK